MTERPRLPLVPCGAALTIGALLAPLPWAPLGVAIVVLAAWTWRTRARVGALFVLCLALGAAAATARLPSARGVAGQLDGRPRGVRARVVELPERTAAGASMIVELDGARVRLAVDRPCGTVGSTVEGTARLIPLETTRMPAFRARSAAIMRGVVATGGLTDCRVIAGPADLVGPDEAAGPLARALARADRGGLDRDGIDALAARAGQSQVLWLGGLAPLALCLGLAALLGAALPARARWIARAAATASAIVLVVALGASPTHLRVAVVIGAVLWAPAPREGLAIAAALVAVADPAGIGDTTFQLAFATTTALVGLAPALGARWRGGPRAWAWSAAASALAIAVGTAPLVLRQFDGLSLSAVALDGLTFPLATATGVAALIAPLWPTPADALAQALTAAWHASAAAPFGVLGTPTVLECVLAYLALGGLSTRPSTPRTRGLGVVSALLLVVIAGAPRLERHLLAQPRVAVLPVYGGHALVVETPRAQTLLVGVGGDAPDPDVHARMILGALRLRHTARLDAVITASTADPAAARTLALIARSFPVEPAPSVALEGARVTREGATVRIELEGAVPLVVSTASCAAPCVRARPDGSPTVYLGGEALDTGARGQVTLDQAPWRARAFRR